MVRHYILLGQQDGEATFQRLHTRLNKRAGLAPEERLDLIFLPLMRHRRSRPEVVRETLDLARQLPERQQRQALASQIGLGHRFFSETELETVLEGLMSTNLGQQLMERGFEQGIAQGREQGIAQGRTLQAQQTVLRVLTRRFGPLPPAVGERLALVDDPLRLEALLDLAVTAGGLEELTQELR